MRRLWSLPGKEAVLLFQYAFRVKMNGAKKPNLGDLTML